MDESDAERLISGQTRILGIIADPVSQARSPAMANSLLWTRSKLGPFVLIPLHVHASGLPSVIKGLRRIENFAGAIVSMPHKMAILPLLDQVSESARQVGAVNVIKRNADATLSGTILDGEGFVAGLLAAGHEVANRACLLAGAGGAGSAIAFALVRHGCRALTILNRTRTRAAELVGRLQLAFPDSDLRMDHRPGDRYDILVNATSLGMRATDSMPISEELALSADLVAECIIAPEMTALLRHAKRNGIAIHTGVSMLSSQLELMLKFMEV